MEKNLGWKDTYSSPEAGNVRYPSTANQAVGGYADVYALDLKCVRELATRNTVHVFIEDRWVSFDGYNLAERAEPEAPPAFEKDAPEDPNW